MSRCYKRDACAKSEFIVTGLALNNTELILRGAIPAALLAIAVEFGFGFGFLEKWWVPKHLR